MRIKSSIENLVRDVRYALRTLRRSPAFTAAVVVTLGLGIGGTTAVFSVVDALFLRPPDGVNDPGSLRRVFVGRDAGNIRAPDGTAGMWSDAQSIRDGSRGFAGIAAYQSPRLIDIGRGESAARIRASLVSADFFPVLGVRPAFGRLFGPEENEEAGAHSVAILSHAAWQSRFGGADDVVGRTVLINNRPMQIVGITPRHFHGIDSEAVDLWLPAGIAVYLGLESDRSWRTSAALSSATRHVGRLRSVADEDRAASDASAALARAAEVTPALDSTPQVVLRPIVLAALPGLSWALDLSLWLLIAAGLVLVISSANVANLLLARGVTRQREFAMRLSLGAGGWRLARQQLTESVALAVLGGAVGVLVAFYGVAVLQQFPLPPGAGRIDGRLLGFSLVLSLLTALAFGVLPALRSIRIDPLQTLKGTQTPRGLARSRTRVALVMLQVSLSFALLVGAALFVRSLWQVSAIRGGVDLDRLLTVEVDLRSDGAPQSVEPYHPFFELASARLAGMPTVERVAVVYTPPFEGWGWSALWRLPGETRYRNVRTYLNVIGPEYFETAGTRLLRGRTIQPSDALGGELVAVVNDALARHVADDGNAVGRCVEIWSPGFDRVPCVHIVGVVESQRDAYLDPEPVAMIFRALAQAPQGVPNQSPMLLVRTRDTAAAQTQTVRAALQGLRSDLPYVHVAPLAERLGELQPFQVGATLFMLFAVLALLLAAVGLYAVLGYFIAERTGEVAIRRALGAPARAVMQLVVRQSLNPVAAGLFVGVGVALGGARVLESRLYGIDPHDPLSLAAAAAFLIAVAALATVVPMRRAIRIDPMVALRRD